MLVRLLLVAGLAVAEANGEAFGGIEFPQGAVSFADEVVEYDPHYSGGAVPTDPNFTDPAEALGTPNYSGGSTGTGSVSLGSGGRLTIKFTNNKLTGSGDSTNDLHIFEVGPQVENTAVEISRDGVTWESVGMVSGSISSIDIDLFGFTATDEFSYVRLTDDPEEGGNTGATAGADIDAVGAVSTTPTTHVPDLLIEPLNSGSEIRLSFASLPGSTYSIEESEDLVNWSDWLVGIEGDGSISEFTFEIAAPTKFFRIMPDDNE